MENLCDSANNGGEGTYDVLYLPTGYDLWAGAFFFLGTSPHTGRGGRQHDQKKKDKHSHPQARRGKAAPLKGRRWDHHSTELNLTSVNLNNLNFSSWKILKLNEFWFKFTFSLCFIQTKGTAAPPKGGWGKQRHLKGGEEAPLQFGWCCFFPFPYGWCCLSSNPLGGAAFPLSSDGWCCMASSSLGWCCFSPLHLGGAACLLFLWVVVLSLPAPCGPFFFFFFWNQPRRRRRWGKAAPLEERGRDRHSTELNSTEVNQNNLNFCCKHCI